jgi:transposase
MARAASGREFLEEAKACLAKARTVNQLRTRFIHNGGRLDEDGPGRGGRRRANLSREEKAAFLAPFLEQAKAGGVLVVGEIKQALDRRLGRETALASVYNLLHRHGWRKLAPDKRHPKSDPTAQEDWKKNSPTPSPNSTGSGLAGSPMSAAAGVPSPSGRFARRW